MNIFAFFALVDLLEVGMVCVTALGIVGIMAKYGARRRKAKGCGCEFCGADEHKAEA